MQRGFKIFGALILVAYLALHLQQHVNFPRLKQLKGAYTETPYPQFSWEAWFNGDWQDKFEKYQKDHLGYRPNLTRVHHQIHYSLFDEIFHNDIHFGKNKNLMGGEYLEAYRGENFIGDSTIRARAHTLGILNKKLADSNKLFLVILAPDKAYSRPQDFNLPPEAVKPNNSESWKKALKKEDIPFIDFRNHFANLEDTSTYPLFPKTGIHWSIWGMHYARDSIAGFIAARSNIPMPRRVLDGVRWSTDYPAIETDMEDALNLWLELPKEELAYPQYHMEGASSKPKVLIISDSFFYEIYSSGLANQYFEAPFFWYYNLRALKYDWMEAPANPNHYKMDSIIKAHDIILMMSASSNLKDFPWAFDTRIKKELIP